MNVEKDVPLPGKADGMKQVIHDRHDGYRKTTVGRTLAQQPRIKLELRIDMDREIDVSRKAESQRSSAQRGSPRSVRWGPQ